MLKYVLMATEANNYIATVSIPEVMTLGDVINLAIILCLVCCCCISATCFQSDAQWLANAENQETTLKEAIVIWPDTSAAKDSSTRIYPVKETESQMRQYRANKGYLLLALSCRFSIPVFVQKLIVILYIFRNIFVQKSILISYVFRNIFVRKSILNLYVFRNIFVQKTEHLVRP